jgi:DNA-binding transcriptional regulator/RsmH inhibitor MraZ
VEMDSQSRIVLPQKLRDKAKLNAEVLVLGKLNFLEVQNEKDSAERFANAEITVDERKSVSVIMRQTS